MLSIITITYNNFNDLIKTIASIPKSDLIESIILNGGQCKETLDYLKSYSGRSISEKDEGIADAFNKGVKLASGKFIMFLNSGDVLIDQSYLKKAIEILEQNKDISFVHSNLILTDSVNNHLYMKPQMKSLGRGMPFLHPTMILEKKLFNQIGYFNINMKVAMDFDWVARLIKNNYKGFYYKDSFVISMAGGGKSIVQESIALKECLASLKANSLLGLENIIGYCLRYALYFTRVLMSKIGLDKFLRLLKKIKYSR